MFKTITRRDFMKGIMVGGVAVGATGLLAACGSSSDSSSESSSSSDSSTSSSAVDTAETSSSSTETETAEILPPESVSMLINCSTTEAPTDDNEAILAIEEYTGCNLDITWVPQSGLNEKINALMASNDMPQIMLIHEQKSSGFVNAARAGMFWDLAPYLDQFPNLATIDKNVLTNVQTDGYQYLLPRLRTVARFGGIVRTDWLENLNMEMPTNIEELHDVLYAFTYDDPDGNGVKDTIGISLNNSSSLLLNCATQINIWLGGPNAYGVDDDGNLYSVYETDTFFTALNWFRNCYAEGLINQDFTTNSSETENFTNGYAGMLFLGNIEDASTRLNALTEVYPDATVDIFQIFDEGYGLHETGAKGFTDAFCIPKTTVETEEEVLQILAYLDKLGDPEMIDLFNWGVEGDSYTLEDGLVVQTEEQLNTYANKYNALRQMTPFYTYTNTEARDVTPLAAKVTQLMTENAQYCVYDPTLPYISDTYTEVGSECDTYIVDSLTKYVIGDLDEDGWWAAVEEWKNMGAEEFIEEYSEAYKEANGL